MCVTASTLGTYEGALVRNIVLFGVLIYELTGPMITKTALMTGVMVLYAVVRK